MARKKMKKKVAPRTPRVARRSNGGRRSGAGRKSIEVHFAALSELLKQGFEKLGVKFDEAPVQEAPVEAAQAEEKPKKARRLKVIDEAAPAAPAPVEASTSVAPVPAPVSVTPVAHAEAPTAVENPWTVPAPGSAQAPSAPNFEAQFNALNSSNS